MVILGIMAAVAVPRYLDSISNAEQSAEDAVISAIRSGLKQAANDSLYTNGRATWPTNPFDALSEKPSGYSTDETDADVDGEWTFSNGRITHQRADNSRYTAGIIMAGCTMVMSDNAVLWMDLELQSNRN